MIARMTKYDGLFVGAGGMDLKIVTVILFFFFSFLATDVRNMNNRVYNTTIMSCLSAGRKICQTPIRVVSWISSETARCMLLPSFLWPYSFLKDQQFPHIAISHLSSALQKCSLLFLRYHLPPTLIL